MYKIVIFLVIAFSVSGFSINASTIIKRSINISTPDRMYSLSRQVVYTYTGKKRVFLTKSWSINRGKDILIEYIKPARVKGDKFLFKKDGDIWAYFSKTGRVRRIASSAKRARMQGSDFSYEDMQIATKLEEDFSPVLKGRHDIDGVDCYKVELIPTKNNISYQKLVAFIDSKSFVMLRLDFYKDGKLIKYMQQSDIKKHNNYAIPYKTTMISLKNETKTEIFTEEVKINIDIPKRMFTKAYLSSN